MPLVWKDLLAPGTYRLTDGRVVSYDAADCRRLAAQGNRMLAAGLRCPLIYDHDEAARPVRMSADAPRRRLARDCVGEARAYATAPGGRLRVLLDIDDDPETLRRLRRVGHVSPDMDWDWRDEQDHVWPGLSMQHIAATPRPIQRHQDRFSLAHDAARGPARPGCVPGIGEAARRPRPQRVSLGHATREGIEMAKDTDETLDVETDTDTDTETETPAPEPGEGGESGLIQSILASLETLGIPLSEVNTITDLKSLDHALKVAAAMKGGGDTGDEGGGMDNTTAASTGGGAMPPPVMMSHGEKNALTKLAAQTGKDLKARVDRLFKTGRINGPVQRSLHGKLQAASLSHESFDPKTCELKPLDVVTEIEAYEKLPPGRFSKENKAGSLSHGPTDAAAPPGEMDPNAAESAVIKRQEELAKRFSAVKT